MSNLLWVVVIMVVLVAVGIIIEVVCAWRRWRYRRAVAAMRARYKDMPEVVRRLPDGSYVRVAIPYERYPEL